MATQHDGYIYGLDTFAFKGVELGLISNDSVEWGGDDPTLNPIWAAQAAHRAAPVKEIMENAGTDTLEFDLIELKPEGLVQVMGGTASKENARWDAPAKRIALEGPVTIRSADGAEVSIKLASLVARPKGKFGYADVFKVHCKMTVLAPADGSSPYGIDLNPTAPAVQ